MLISTKAFNNGSNLSFLNYSHIQQINCIKISSIQQQQTEQSLPLKPRKYTLATHQTRYKYLRFYQPYRKFVNRHKIIHKIRSKTKALKPIQRNNTTRTVIRRVIPVPPKVIHEDTKNKEQILLGVFDWMMQAASLMKITKNAYYRAILILMTAAEHDGRLVSSKRINEIACAALVMGCKFECSQRNYMEEVYLVNCRRITKLQISYAEHCILKALDWNIPVHVELQETLALVLGHWGQFLRDYGGKFERGLYGKCFHAGQGRLLGKFYIQVVYVLDYLIIRRCAQWLREGSFTQPMLVSLYMMSSLSVGDVHLDQYNLWPLFLKFVDYYRILPKKMIDNVKVEIGRCCTQYNIIQVLGQMPIQINFERLIKKKNQQFYIPKVECIL